jgi:hypothetical protein
LSGEYNKAVIYKGKLESKAEGQILDTLNSGMSIGSKVRCMSDVHVGGGVCWGITMAISGREMCLR